MKKLLTATTALSIALTAVSPAFANNFGGISYFKYDDRLAKHEQLLKDGKRSGYDVAGDGWETCIPGVCFIGEDTLPAGTLKPVVLNAQALLIASKQQPSSVLVASTDNSFVYLKSPFIEELATQNKVDYERMADILWSGPKSWSETMQIETAKIAQIATIMDLDVKDGVDVSALQTTIDNLNAQIDDLKDQLTEKPTEVIVEVIKEVMVEVPVEVIKEVTVEVIKEVEVEKIVEVEVIKEVIKTVVETVTEIEYINVEVPGPTIVETETVTEYVHDWSETQKEISTWATETYPEDAEAAIALLTSFDSVSSLLDYIDSEFQDLDNYIAGLETAKSALETQVATLKAQAKVDAKEIADLKLSLGDWETAAKAYTQGMIDGANSVDFHYSNSVHTQANGTHYAEGTLTNGKTISVNAQKVYDAGFAAGAASVDFDTLGSDQPITELSEYILDGDDLDIADNLETAGYSVGDIVKFDGTFYRISGDAEGTLSVTALTSGLHGLKEKAEEYTNTLSTIGSLVYNAKAMDPSLTGFTLESIVGNLDNIIANIEAAYEVGYKNGYDDGFEDGYKVGFADGVASVSTTTE